MKEKYKRLFQHATAQDISPYKYQLRLATEPWPEIVNVPTGMGKTAAVILSWLHKRAEKDPDTPRRLVYCLPMRVLVEQTVINARRWVDNIVASGMIEASNKPTVHVLMGGDADIDWDMYPEGDAILIGTQDQLLSRALNRGYAMSRFRWPVHFGLLNNDCLWVFDEVQLMGSGLSTSTQLQAFRYNFGTVLPCRSIWMSATLDKSWLDTVDFKRFTGKMVELGLGDEDVANNESLNKRFQALKPISKADCPAEDFNKIAQLILDSHKPYTRTLVVLNKVKRALAVYDNVKKMNPLAELTPLHSRFRLEDRARSLSKLLDPPPAEGTICISTQVVEAGVDVSATTLITDLAPWASLVQRFGRCNREGRDDKARVFWLGLDITKKGASLPYTEEELLLAANLLNGMSDVGPKSLPRFEAQPDYKHVIRSKDIIDLFDTTPDLAGADIDVSRFIREAEDHDVQVFWRDFPDGKPKEDEPAPTRDEICSVSINDLKSVKEIAMWRWDHLDKGWISVPPSEIYPGLLIMLHAEDGLYSSEKGWTGDRKDNPNVIETAQNPPESNDDDLFSKGIWQSLSEHNDLVVEELQKILSKCSLRNQKWVDTLNIAVRWHDAGKAHEVFQKAMLGNPAEVDEGVIWAKTARKEVRYERLGFRHELASALAMVQHGLPDLAVYLAAAHHGKVRLSIRSIPNEKKPPDADIRFARGIWDGDTLSEVDLGGGQQLGRTTIKLSLMEFGNGPDGPSWLSQMLALRDDQAIGPFRLAFLEALIRAADWRGSKKATENVE